MSSYVPSEAESEFLEAVRAVFAEHEPTSSRFGLCDLDRLSGLFNHSRGERFGLRRNDNEDVTAVTDEQPEVAADAEKISPTFPASIQNPFAPPINPATGEPEGACLAVMPDLTGEGLGWSCVVYLTS